MDNSDPFPYSFEFFDQPQVENMRSIGEHFNNRYVIEGNTSKMRLAQFVPLDTKISFAFKKIPRFRISRGNIWKTDYDVDYMYDLPYNKGGIFMVIQGYNGEYSHKNQYAVDFKMPEGTEILAAREGYVTEIKQDSNIGCPSEACVSQGNFVRIIHSDGTIAEYYHLKYNGAKVKTGDKVEKGQTIGLSGNTGWSSGPHLHFDCYLPGLKGKRIYVKTLFRINDGEKTKYLIQGNNYKRDY
jgi:murein DD-endopeptidase MepM/ murein hydrolase activator NlpD